MTHQKQLTRNLEVIMSHPLINKPCTECSDGTYHSVIEDYHTLSSEGKDIVVPNIEFIKCDMCRDTLISSVSSRKISEHEGFKRPKPMTRQRLLDNDIKTITECFSDKESILKLRTFLNGCVQEGDESGLELLKVVGQFASLINVSVHEREY